VRSANSRPISNAESEHIAKVKKLRCSWCWRAGPSEAHHPWQGLQFCVVPACHACHSNKVWQLGGLTEIQALDQCLYWLDCKARGELVVYDPMLYKRQKSTRTPTKIIPRSV
jgi:hypothetical protein